MARVEVADYENEPAPTLDEVIRAERGRELQVGWRIEYIPCLYIEWFPRVYWSYKSHPWGFREGWGFRWLRLSVRFHGRLTTW